VAHASEAKRHQRAGVVPMTEGAPQDKVPSKWDTSQWSPRYVGPYGWRRFVRFVVVCTLLCLIVVGLMELINVVCLAITGHPIPPDGGF